MNIISLPRGNGKTVQLIKMSAENNIPIVVNNECVKRCILKKSKDMNLTIPEPIVYYSKANLRDIKDVYIDNIDYFVSNLIDCNVVSATITEDKDYNSHENFVNSLVENLDILVKNYNKCISKTNDTGAAINILKNIDMIVNTVKTIKENRELRKLFYKEIDWSEVK